MVIAFIQLGKMSLFSECLDKGEKDEKETNENNPVNPDLFRIMRNNGFCPGEDYARRNGI